MPCSLSYPVLSCLSMTDAAVNGFGFMGTSIKNRNG